MIPNPTQAEETFAANRIRSSIWAPTLHWPLIGDIAIIIMAWSCSRAIKRLRARGGAL